MRTCGISYCTILALDVWFAGVGTFGVSVVGNTCLYVPQILNNVVTEAAVNAHLFIVPGAVVDRMGRVVLQLETSTTFRGFELS